MLFLFEPGQCGKDIAFCAMSPPKRDYTNSFSGSHGCYEKYDLALIINGHVFVPPLFNRGRIAGNK